MPSITTWTRLEPRARGDDLRPSLEARVYDPAWLLGRQWQVGEFVGEDGGSPVTAALEVVEAQPILGYRTTSASGPVRSGAPVDCIVGAEPAGTASLAERAEAGAEFVELLLEGGCSANGIRAVVGTHVIPPFEAGSVSHDGEALLSLSRGRLPDGQALTPLLESIRAAKAVDRSLGLSPADEAAVLTAVEAWMDWRASLIYRSPALSWVDERLEHRFELTVPPTEGADVTLVAPSWDGRPLDWYDLDVVRRVPSTVTPASLPPLAPPPEAASAAPLKASGVPVSLTYPGMPASRWWQFENANVSFANIAAAPDDLARMLVVEFATVYSNDWYLWPVVVPLGAMLRIKTLLVVNTFGDTVNVTAVASSADNSARSDWQLFRPTLRHDGGSGAYDGLLLMAALASPLEGPIIEEVRFVRDEVANLAWAIEATVRGEDGLPLDRNSAAAAAGDLAASAQGERAERAGPLRYELETHVPLHWFPLVPDEGGKPIFRRLLLPRFDAAGQPRDGSPRGQLISREGLWLWQEEVPREGTRVLRRHRMTRGSDGDLYVWSARQRGTGRGEGSSGLRYDQAIAPPELPEV